MSNVLILRAECNPKLVEPMLATARFILDAKGFRGDEFAVPSIIDIPTSINHYMDSKTYEGILAIGAMVRPLHDIGQEAIYREVIHQLAEFSCYYSFPIGIAVCLADQKTKVTEVTEFTESSVTSLVGMVERISRLNAMEDDFYARTKMPN